MKLLLFAGNTTSNIGNQFFYDGVKYVLGKQGTGIDIIEGAFPMANAYKLNKTYEANIFDFGSYLGDLDGIVISGPVLDKDFGHFFLNTMRIARASNKKVFLISVGGRKYDKEEIDHCSAILGEIKPDIFMTRDSDTYAQYKAYAKNAYDGICFAFFISDYFKGYNIPELQYLCSTFDFTNEPGFKINKTGGDYEVLLSKMNVKTKSKIDKVKYVLQRNLPDQVDGLKIVRLCHRPLRNKNVMFHKRNIVVSHSSHPYLNLYKNAEFTLTDRLHAAVATLAFGKPARLFLDSNRVKLLDRARIENCLKEMTRANLDYLSEEKSKMTNWLINVL